MKPPVLNPDAFAARLVRARLRSGLTVDQAAEVCGLPVSTFEAYLYRNNLPGAQSLHAIAIGLGVSVDWLLFGGSDQHADRNLKEDHHVQPR